MHANASCVSFLLVRFDSFQYLKLVPFGAVPNGTNLRTGLEVGRMPYGRSFSLTKQLCLESSAKCDLSHQDTEAPSNTDTYEAEWRVFQPPVAPWLSEK